MICMSANICSIKLTCTEVCVSGCRAAVELCSIPSDTTASVSVEQVVDCTALELTLVEDGADVVC